MGRRKYTDAQLEQAVHSCRTIREILVKLGLAPYGGNYETVRQRIAELGLSTPNLRIVLPGRRLSSCTDEEIISAVAASRSLAQVLARLRMRPGGTQSRLKSRIEQLDIDTSHFMGQAWRRGIHTPVVSPRPIQELLVDGRLLTTNSLKKRLFEEGLKQRRCETCSRETWNGVPIPLELDHINGRREDNRLTNLRILCPNCHAQTSTYRGRNIGLVTAYSEGSSPGGEIFG